LGKREPLKEVYRLKREGLAVLERLSEFGYIELLYGDAAHISEMPNVPYGWQFGDEKVFMPSEKGKGINLFDFISRANRLIFEMTNERITGDYVIRQIEKLLDTMKKPTVIVLDNASAHRNKKIPRANPVLGGARFVYLLFAGLFTAFEHRGDSMEKVKIRMAVSGGLLGLGEFEISSQIRLIKCGKFIENQLFRIQL
jgi:hypothetical protein